MPFGTDCDSRKGSGRNRGLDYRQNVEHVSAARGITNGKAYRTHIEENLYEDRELITRGDANEGIDAHPALYENVVGRAVNQIPGIGYFVMALASLPGKLVLGWVVLMGAAFSIIGTAIASLARQ